METKDKILSSAKKLFAKSGFQKVSVRDIAQDAGVAISAMNYHFKTKDILFSSIVTEFVEEHTKSYIDILSEPMSREDIRLKLEIYANTHIVISFKDIELYRIVHSEARLRNPLFDPVLHGPIKIWFMGTMEFLQKAVEKGFLKSDTDVEFLVSVFVSVISQAVAEDDFDPFHTKRNSLTEPAYRQKWVRNYVALLLDGALA